jgi:hypothetical protein
MEVDVILYRVLRSILFLESCGVCPTAKSIAHDVCVPISGLLKKIESDGLVYSINGNYVLTEEGQQTLDSAEDHPYYAEDDSFRDRVLWPVEEEDWCGAPVLPRPQKRHNSNPDGQMISGLDAYLEAEDCVRAVMARYGYDLEKTMSLVNDNRIAFCPNCQCWGVMRYHSDGYLRNKCIICEGRKKPAE